MASLRRMSIRCAHQSCDRRVASALPRLAQSEQQCSFSRRAVLQAAWLGVAAAGGSAHPRSAHATDDAEPLPASSSSSRSEPIDLVLFESREQGYSIRRPAAWEQLGVTVLPVRIRSLAEFGDLAQVGQRLLDAERAKESTLGVALVGSAARSLPGSPQTQVYDYEYELESTRGRKRILSTVAVADAKLYIANGSITCDKETCAAQEGGTALLRAAVQSLAVQ
eukprot:scaffold15.g4299.t1